MPTKRGPLVKVLRKFVAEFPPENLAPWKEPNRKMKAVIDKNVAGKLEEALEEAQEGILQNYLTRLHRKGVDIMDLEKRH